MELIPDGEGRVVMRRAKIRSVTDLFGILPAGCLPATNDELDDIIGEAIVEHVLGKR